MKKLLFAVLMALSVTCFAKTIALTKNQVGGLMILTDEPCNENTSVAITTEADGGKPERGCWLFWEGAVYIKWDANERVIAYPAEVFKAPADV